LLGIGVVVKQKFPDSLEQGCPAGSPRAGCECNYFAHI